MYQSNVSSLHKFKLQEEVSEKNRDGEHKFPKIQRDHWGGCHGHSGQRTTEGRLGGATKNGGRGQGWIGVGGGRNRAWERARFRESERAAEPARQVCLARPSSVARSPRSSRSLLARVPPARQRQAAATAALAAVAAAQTAELLYLSSFSFSGGSAINRVLRHQNRRWHFGNIENVDGEEGQGRRSEAPPPRPRGARGPGPGKSRASRTGSAPPPTSTTDITPPPHDAIRGGGRDRCEDDRGGRRCRGGGAVEGETDDD